MPPAQYTSNSKPAPHILCNNEPMQQPAKVAGTKIKCPCQTGKPIKLFHLKHRGGAGGASPLPGGVGGGAAAAGGEPGVDAAVLAAAKQRAERLREALDEERQRGAELERTLVLQVEETSRALVGVAQTAMGGWDCGFVCLLESTRKRITQDSARVRVCTRAYMCKICAHVSAHKA